jgi:hypothetical protein
VLRLGLHERGITEILGVSEHVVSLVASGEGLRLRPDVPVAPSGSASELIQIAPDAPPEARATLDQIAAWSRDVLSIAHVPAFWRALARRPRLLAAVWEKHRLVLGSGELAPDAKISVALAVAMNKRSPYWTTYFAQLGRASAMFDDDVIVEIAGATLHYTSFNTISHGMMLKAPHRDIVASEFAPEAPSRRE